jgi:hypothetical protein
MASSRDIASNSYSPGPCRKNIETVSRCFGIDLVKLGPGCYGRGWRFDGVGTVLGGERGVVPGNTGEVVRPN